MLRSPPNSLLRSLSRPVWRSAAELSTNRSVNNTTVSQKRTSQNDRQSRTQEQRKNPAFLASALSATATTIGGTLLYTIVSHKKEKDDESQYASRAEMELVRNTKAMMIK